MGGYIATQFLRKAAMKYLPRVRLYPEKQKDREILNWLKDASGPKGDLIKEAIWRSISDQGQAGTSASSIAMNRTSSKIQAKVTFDTHELLADIRQIVEIGVAQALAQVSIESNEQSMSGDQEVDDLLDDLDFSFALPEE